MRNKLLILLVVFLPIVLMAGTTGKIAGVVTDAETGQALTGANVQIEGTMLGAATDQDGNYIILNVPVGRHNVIVSFMGYTRIIKQDIRVSVDLTTDVLFNMNPETIEGQTVVIVAERPLVNKNVTNETRIMTSDDFANIPLRDFANIAATNTGVVSARGTMYVRGGRADEVAFYVDGIYNNDLRTGARVGDIPIESVEELSYQAGGFNAEYGFANSGIVVASSKTGGGKYNVVGEVITDEFLSKTDPILNTYSYGYNVYNLSASGPVPGLKDKLSFYVSAENTFRRDRSPSTGPHPVLDGEFTYDEIMMTEADLDAEGVPDADKMLPVKEVDGPLPNNALTSYAINANILLKLSSINIQLGGNGSMGKWDAYNQFRSLVNSDHFYYNSDFNYSAYLKITHTLDPNTFYQATGYYSAFGNEFRDPLYDRELFNYGDKTDVNGDGIFNANLNQDGNLVQSAYRLGSGIYDLPTNPSPQYALNRSSVMGGKVDFTHQIGKTHEIKTGGEFRYNTIRRYAQTRPWAIAGIYANNANADYRDAARSVYTENFGYPAYFEDADGDPTFTVDPSQTVDSGPDAAKHPLIGAFYLQDKIELNDLVLNIGLRADYIDANDKKPADPYNLVITKGTINQDSLVSTKSYLNINPRLGISFPVTDRTVFHAQYGVFVQQPELQYLYTGWDYYAGQVEQGNMVTIGNPDLKPTKTTSYEVGIGQELSPNSSISITAYYKEITDNVVLKNRVNAIPGTYPQYQNGDYGNVKGLSFTYKLRRTERLSGNLNYTLQYASGTGSTSGSNFYIAWIGQEYYPIFVAPLDYDQRHTLSANVDFRTKPNDGPVLFGKHVFGNIFLNMLAEIGSGFPYTPKRIGDTIWAARFATAYPTGSTNSANTDWTYNMDMKITKKITVSKVDMNVYLWIINVLGSKQPFGRKNDQQNFTSGIYEATGRPDDNGWLTTNDGRRWIDANYGQRAEDMYRSYIDFPANWNEPRQIRLGLRFEM